MKTNDIINHLWLHGKVIFHLLVPFLFVNTIHCKLGDILQNNEKKFRSLPDVWYLI